jgi:hypothetical protein
MCRPTTSLLQTDVACPELALALVYPVVDKGLQCASKAMRGDRHLVSILRPSSYDRFYPIKRCKGYAHLPGLIVSREPSTDSLRSKSSESLAWDRKPSKPKISFCPTVLVKEFHRLPWEKKETQWYNADELREFSREVAALVRDYDRQHWYGFFHGSIKFTHSHPALTHSNDEDDADCESSLIVATPTVRNQFNRVLLLDSHDLSLKLFAMAFFFTCLSTRTCSYSQKEPIGF